MAGLASHKSASGLGVDALFRASVAAHPRGRHCLETTRGAAALTTASSLLSCANSKSVKIALQ